MPNWCNNTLTIQGEEKDVEKFAKKLHKIRNENNKVEDLLKTFVSMPKKSNPDDWYNWNCDNWGTKWDACESYINHNDIDFFSVTFDTAWSPPIEWIKYIMKDFPDLRFSLEYDEPGCAFGGNLQAQYKLIWEDNIWDLESASECCQGPINWEHEELEQQCLICGEETETISINVADIKPAKIKL